ncbi:hypothetical protein FACS1894168_2690 [Deltaproteobacteria bacterium]|nr:hypothetical protein FACS1894168_2690 [Deltaproteobacteria bacterium]
MPCAQLPDLLLDELRLALRSGNAESSLQVMKKLLAAAKNRGDIPDLLALLEETARWELQSGADPFTVCHFLAALCKRRADAAGIKRCARMVAIYREMEDHGVDIRSMEACRAYMEQKNWLANDNVSKQGRKDFEQSIGYWRQLRLLSFIDPLLEAFPGARWLTLGDGRHAIEARYIAARGSHATPSDITDIVLKETREAGLIPDYRIEFFEKLSVPDAAYDFVLAKDALHHCSRPWLGLYEMLRAAGEGICFLEPYDYSWWHSVLPHRPGDVPHPENRGWHGFEDGVGNYIFSFMDREVAKFCMGMGLPFLACKGFHDFYHAELDCRKAEEGSDALNTIKKALDAQSARNDYALIAWIILKRPPLSPLRERLQRDGYTFVPLPRNAVLENAFLTNKAFADSEE